ncbi:hypothetical protein [Ureibacillus manganicus]|nr:hypothetical protein [Ureibacillus manganicus]
MMTFLNRFLGANGLHHSYQDLFEWNFLAQKVFIALMMTFLNRFLGAKGHIALMMTFLNRFLGANGLHHSYQDLFEWNF